MQFRKLITLFLFLSLFGCVETPEFTTDLPPGYMWTCTFILEDTEKITLEVNSSGPVTILFTEYDITGTEIVDGEMYLEMPSHGFEANVTDYQKTLTLKEGAYDFVVQNEGEKTVFITIRSRDLKDCFEEESE